MPLDYIDKPLAQQVFIRKYFVNNTVGLYVFSPHLKLSYQVWHWQLMGGVLDQYYQCNDNTGTICLFPCTLQMIWCILWKDWKQSTCLV